MFLHTLISNNLRLIKSYLTDSRFRWFNWVDVSENDLFPFTRHLMISNTEWVHNVEFWKVGHVRTAMLDSRSHKYHVNSTTSSGCQTEKFFTKFSGRENYKIKNPSCFSLNALFSNYSKLHHFLRTRTKFHTHTESANL